MKLKYRGGSALNSLVTKMRNGGTPSITDPKKESGNGNGVGQPVLNLQDKYAVESLIRRGLASSADPEGDVTIAMGEGSPVEFKKVLDKFMKDNPDLVDSSKEFYQVGDERVFTDSGDDRARYRDVVRPAHMRGVDFGRGDSWGAIKGGLEAEFDKYIDSFGDKIKNDPEKIKFMKDKFLEEARNYATGVETRRGY